jgi:hypothetical protein
MRHDIQQTATLNRELDRFERDLPLELQPRVLVVTPSERLDVHML